MDRWHALRCAIVAVDPRNARLAIALALSDTTKPVAGGPATSSGSSGHSPDHSSDHSAGQSRDQAEADRLRALVDLARAGDSEAFGQLYDHYVTGIFKFIYYRVGSRQFAEDLTSETFMRALRSIQRFTWQGRDFGAWLTTIARNLVADHHKSGRSRLEFVTDDLPETHTESGTEATVIRQMTDEQLFDAINTLSEEQRDCVLMRFIQELTVAQTAAALGRSEGAVKQLQFRAVRNLAKIIDEDLR